MLRASEFYRVRHCLASVRLSEEVRGTPQEAPVDELAEQGHQEHKEFAAGNDSYQQHLAKRELETWADGHKYTVYNEQELYLRHESLEPYFVGHPDRYAIRDDGACLIIESKTGPILELDAWSTQIECYAYLVKENHPGITSIRRVIVSKYHGLFVVPPQPIMVKTEAQVFLNDGMFENRVPTPGRWCRYCPARLVCPEAPRAIEPYLKGEELPIGADGAELLSRLHVLKKLVTEKIGYYEDLVRKDPAILAGKWKVGKGKRYGEIISITQALIALTPLMPPRDFLEATAKLSYAKLRDFVMEQKGLTKKDAEAALSDILGDLLVFKEGEGNVVEAVPEITE